MEVDQLPNGITMTHKLQELLADVNGSTFISIDTITTPKLTGGQKNPHQGKVRKVTIGSNVMVFTNKNGSAYDNMVRRRLEQEGKDPATFELGERRFGERVAGTPFIEHNGELYLECIFLRAGETHFEAGVRPIDRSDVIGLTEPKEGKQGGLDKKVVIRTINVNNIKQITVNKETHIL